MSALHGSDWSVLGVQSVFVFVRTFRRDLSRIGASVRGTTWQVKILVRLGEVGEGKVSREFCTEEEIR